MPNTVRPPGRPARPAVLALAAGLTMLLALAGCGGGGPETLTGAVTAREGTSFGAAELRAELTTTLTAHPYLLAAAIAAGAPEDPTPGGDGSVPSTAGPAPDPGFTLDAAKDALDRNSIELAGTLGGAYGEGLREDFLEAWRRLYRDQLDRARAVAEHDTELTRALSSRIVEDRLAIGRLLGTVNENLTAKGTARELRPLTSGANDAAKRIVRGKDGLEPLRATARSGASVAEVLATAIATQQPDSYRGDADSPAAALRAELTTTLISHVYLVGLDPGAPAEAGQGPSRLTPSDRNAVALRGVVREAYGRSAARIFLPGWRAHTRLLHSYYGAVVRGQPDQSSQIEGEVAEYRARLARLIADRDPEISVEEVSDALRSYLSATLAMLRSEAGDGAADPAEAMREAANTMPSLAGTLADAAVRGDPKRFPATGG